MSNKTRLEKLEAKRDIHNVEPIEEITLDIIGMDKSIVESYIIKDGILHKIDND